MPAPMITICLPLCICGLSQRTCQSTRSLQRQACSATAQSFSAGGADKGNERTARCNKWNAKTVSSYQPSKEKAAHGRIPRAATFPDQCRCYATRFLVLVRFSDSLPTGALTFMSSASAVNLASASFSSSRVSCNSCAAFSSPRRLA